MRPPVLAKAWPRDLLWLLLLASLAAALVPYLNVDWQGLLASGDSVAEQIRRGRAYQQFLSGVTRRMAAVDLPMALGFLLCLRCGAVDLSLWSVSSLAGVIAARGILGHLGPAESIALGVLAGAGIGAVNGVLTAVLRVPSLIATFGTGLLVLFLLQGLQPGRQVVVPEQTFSSWHLSVEVAFEPREGPAGAAAPASRPEEATAAVPVVETESQPRYVTRMLLALGAYSTTMLVLMGADWLRPRSWGPGARKRVWAALTASGALAGVGGVLWLIEHDAAVVASRPVDDFTIPVAVVLSGATFLGGRGRTLLSAVFLPGSLLLVSLWKQEVWPLQRMGLSLHLVLLGFMALLVHVAGSDFTTGPRERRPWALVSCLLAVAGIVLVAAGAGTNLITGRWIQILGLCVWMLAAIFLLICRARAPGEPTAP